MAKERLPKVLVVEDEPSVREALSVLFKRNGFEVEGSESGDPPSAGSPSTARWTS